MEGTQHLLERLRTSAPAARLVIASSAAVYGDSHSGPIGEDAWFAPASPYGTHKAMIELLAHCYARDFGLSVAVVRLFSVYGPGLRKQLVWELVNRLLRGEKTLTLGGTGEELRDFLHIGDAAAMLLDAAALAGRPAAVFNGCTGRATRIADLAAMLCPATTAPCQASPARAGRATRSASPANLRARARPASPHRPELEAGLAETCAWIASVASQENRL